MLVLVVLTACETAAPRPARQDDSLSWAQEPAPAPSNGAIYQVGRDVALFENPIARHIGDTVTIVLDEATAAKKSATTTTTKNTTTALPGMTLFGSPVTAHGTPLLANNINDANKFNGEGDSAQSNSLTGFVAATVVRVLPNGNMLIRGEKQIWINQGSEYVRLEGVIRPIDLAPDNTISSHKVAGARISYGGKGALADVNAQGWLSRFFNSPWTPF
jgi:flagellar L-ring protein precursor FlgH